MTPAGSMAAPKAKGTSIASVNGRPKILKTERVKLDDISVCDDSGWRERDPREITILRDKFKAGEYGNGILTIPSILCWDQKPKVSLDDGRWLINNGRSTIAALKELFQETQPGHQFEDPVELHQNDWVVGELAEIFESGVRCDFVQYFEDDRDLVVAWNALAHDADNNRYRQTSIETKVKVVENTRARVPGGDWQLVVKALMATYGPSKKGTIYRWINTAKFLAAELLAHIKGRTDFHQGFVMDNKYLVGHGDDAKFKLTPEYGKHALNLLFDKVDASRTITVEQFITEFCHPVKQVELWEKAQRTKFGSAACDKLPAFARVMTMLVTERGRVATLQCVRCKIPLSGSGTDKGIDECQLVVEELQRMKDGPKPETTGSTLPADTSASDDAMGGDPQPNEGASADGDFLALELDASEDPVAASARGLVEKDLNHICCHTTKNTFDNDVVSRVLPTQKAVFFIDAVTSKQKVLNELVEHCAALIARIDLKRYVVACPVGCRVDLLSGVANAIQRQFPTLHPYIVQCTAGETQNPRVIPSYIVILSKCEGEAVPNTARINKARSMAYEGLRLRCTSRNCRHRPEEAGGGQDSISLDDQEPEGHLMDIDEDEEIDLGAMDVDAADDGEPYVVDLFPFAKPIKYYENVLSTVCHCETAPFLVVLSRSAHPGVLIGGRAKGLEVIAYFPGVHAHNYNHGQALLESILTKRCWAQAKKTTVVAIKRVRSSEMPFIVAQAPLLHQQVARVMEVPGDAALSAWRAGVNLLVPDLPMKMSDLLASELQSNDLQIVSTEFGRGLACGRAYREGEVICKCSTLWYTSPVKLQEMLSQGGNKFLLDRLVRVDGLLMGDGEETSSIYGALVGGAGYVQHYQGLRKAGPNAILKVNTEKGPNDGFMQLVVKTRNNQGIAAKQVVCINYGSDYDFTITADDTEKEVKKFRGALDKYFAREEKAADIDATPPKAAPTGPPTGPKAKAASAPETPAVPPEPKAKAKAAAPEPEAPTPEAKAKAPAAPKAPPAAGEPPAKAAGVASAPVAQAGEKELCGDVKSLGVKLVYAPDTRSFWFVSDAPSNRKIPPHTKLHLIRDGKLQMCSEAGSVPYDMTRPKKTFVCVLQSSDRTDLSELKALDSVISEMKIKKVLLHDDLPAPGACPDSLTGKSGYAFVATGDEVKKMVKDGSALGQAKFFWAFKYNSKESLLSPYGVVLGTTKQALVTAKMRSALS